VPQLDLARLQSLVEEAIDQGASTVGEIHQAIAAAPLEALASIDPLSGPADKAADITHRSIGAVYDTIRAVNEQVGVLAEQLLSKQKDL
jgi:hypothetical protein